MTKSASIPVLALVRVSSDMQDVQRQINMLNQRAAKEGWHIVKVLREEISASKKKNSARPVVQELLRLAQASGFRKLWIEAVNRLGRQPAQVHRVREALTEAGISIWFERYGMETLLPDGQKNPMAAMVFALNAEQAEDEMLELSPRLRSGVAAFREKERQADPVNGGKWGRCRLPNNGSLSDADLLRAIRTSKYRSSRPFKPAQKYRDTLRLLEKGVSQRKIAAAVSLNRETVSKLAKLRERVGTAALAWLNSEAKEEAPLSQ